MGRSLEALEIPPAFRVFPGKGHGLGLIPTRLHLAVISLYSNRRTPGSGSTGRNAGNFQREQTVPADSRSRRALLSIL
jgi:hypothetical protein